MNILANRDNKRLFAEIALSVCAVSILECFLIGFLNLDIYISVVISGALIIALITFSVLRYIQKQSRIIEEASDSIRSYLSGNRNSRIECSEEGDIYILFHEINSLAAILDAQAEKEKESRIFLKNTISDISHQLKTPLAALNIYNGIMQGDPQDVDAVTQFTSLSEQELDRIETLVLNLLKLTKLDAGTMVMNKKKENLYDILRAIEKSFAYRAVGEKKEFTLSGDENTPLFCDRDWISEAVSNIVKNAFDHTNEGNFIHMECRSFASISQIIIKDNGSGIHEEDIHHIFKRFYRSRFSKDTKGVGLGLPLSKYIVEAHDGTIEVDSRLNFGTVFTINFPNTTEL